MADTEVGGQEGVGVGEGPHGDVRRGPLADAGEREQPGAHLVTVGAGVEHEPVVDGGGQAAERPPTRLGHADARQIVLGDRRG